MASIGKMRDYKDTKVSLSLHSGLERQTSVSRHGITTISMLVTQMVIIMIIRTVSSRALMKVGLQRSRVHL